MVQAETRKRASTREFDRSKPRFLTSKLYASVYLLKGVLVAVILVALWPCPMPILWLFAYHMVVGFMASDMSSIGQGSTVYWLTRPLPLLVISFPLSLVLLCFCIFEALALPLEHFVFTWTRNKPIIADTTVKVAPQAQPLVEAGRHARSNDAYKKKMNQYVSHEAVWDALSSREDTVLLVRLVKLSWLIELGTPGSAVHTRFSGVLPRRQEMPEEAFIDAEELERVERGAKLVWDPSEIFRHAGELLTTDGNVFVKLYRLFRALFFTTRNSDGLLPILAISYCWLEAAHPDRQGKQIEMLSMRLRRRLYKGRSLVSAFKAYGFREVGVFIDWASLCLKDPALWKQGMSGEDLLCYENSRHSSEKVAFDRALQGTMDLWYGHVGTTVALLTEFPDGCGGSRAYETRGWTSFERCCAELGKSLQLRTATWKLVIDLSDAHGGAERRLPTTPERMVDLLSNKVFTNGADLPRVLELYERVATAILGGVKKLNFTNLHMSLKDEWRSPSRLASALQYCESLEELSMLCCKLDDVGVSAMMEPLLAGALPQLKRLDLAVNRITALGLKALGEALSGGVAAQLQFLSLVIQVSQDGPGFGDDGARAIASAIRKGAAPQLKALDIGFNDVGDAGAIALAAALSATSSQCRPACGASKIGVAGRAALAYVLERNLGGALYMNLLPGIGDATFPSFLWRAFARGWHTMFETHHYTWVS